jgi:RNA polymerase sigma-70 factor (ECF subfamily)
VDDGELMERVREGDACAFEVLFERHREGVRRSLATMLRDDSAAEDLTQEAFLRVWTHADQWTGRGGFRPWLHRIGLNLALNHQRSVRRRREDPLEVPRGTQGVEPRSAQATESPAPSPEELLELAERQGTLWRMVGSLPGEKREVLRLLAEEELELSEVADRLGVPVGTVKSRLHYARKQLVREWKEWEAR